MKCHTNFSTDQVLWGPRDLVWILKGGICSLHNLGFYLREARIVGLVLQIQCSDVRKVLGAQEAFTSGNYDLRNGTDAHVSFPAGPRTTHRALYHISAALRHPGRRSVQNRERRDLTGK